MTKLKDKVAVQMAHRLRPGESILAAAVVEHRGGPPTVKERPGIARHVPAAGRTVWALTDQRMIFFGYELGRRVGELLSAIPLGEVASVRAHKARVALDKLELAFADGSGIRLDLHTDEEADAINRSFAALTPAAS